MQVPAIDRPKKSIARFGELQNRQQPARFQHAESFAQSRRVVGQVAKTECARHKIERGIGKGQTQRIGFKIRRRRARLSRALFSREQQHSVGKIHANHASASRLRKGHPKVSRPAAKIEHCGIRPHKNPGKPPRRSPPPHAV